MNIISSNRGSDVLCYEGHQYLHKKYNANGTRLWRCRQFMKFRCPSHITTNPLQVVGMPSQHCHIGDSLAINVNKAMDNMKKRAKTCCETTRMVIAENVCNLTNDTLVHMPKLATMEQAVRRSRKSTQQLLGNPQNISFEIPERYSDIVFIDSGSEDSNRIIGLGHKDIIPHLSSSVWFCDGTFDVVPAMFFQLYTIHVQIGNRFPPCIYFLLPNKTANTYERMIEILKRKFTDLSPSKILLDFENAAINSFQLHFPNSLISGCHFHLCQSLIRKVGTLGLKRQYESDDNFKFLVKSLPALAFVPHADMESCFLELSREFPEDPACDELLVYFDATYLRGRMVGARAAGPMFPPELWNHFTDGQYALPKTTNCCEGFHNALQSLFLCKHPTVWKLFDGLRRDMAVHRLVVQQASVENYDPHCILNVVYSWTVSPFVLVLASLTSNFQSVSKRVSAYKNGRPQFYQVRSKDAVQKYYQIILHN